ncbi:ankyrin repeat domain-containing protein [Streptomyces sp. NPDC059651]|uniref:ankyrin repeat domain-containing protein n=1 Tax=Streptomyces sp. NPDC059651 TaxID=3346897 RepID=UPI0036C30F6B
MAADTDTDTDTHTDTATSLGRAVDDLDLVRLEHLLTAGADPHAKDRTGHPPLNRAAARGWAAGAELLLRAGADPHLLDTRTGASALHGAAQCGATDVIALLLDHGAFVDQQAPTHGHTPLIDAVWHKRAPAVALLLRRGANPDIAAHGGYRADELGPLACDEDQRTYVRLITRARAARARAQSAPLHEGARTGGRDVVAQALDAGHGVDTRAPDGHTPLLDAAREGHDAVVRTLLDRGADASLTDHLMRATAAHKAAYNGRADVLATLVRDPRLALDAQGPYNGYTALHDAVWHGHLASVRVLLAAGARTDLRGRDGRTPREMARDYGYAEIAALLRTAGQPPREPAAAPPGRVLRGGPPGPGGGASPPHRPHSR